MPGACGLGNRILDNRAFCPCPEAAEREELTCCRVEAYLEAGRLHMLPKDQLA